MFDLSKTISDWRSKLQETGRIRTDQLDELESHLCDQVDELIHGGLTAEEAFDRAVKKFGKTNELVEEFSKIRKPRFGLVELANGKVINISDGNNFPRRKLTWLLLFVGFCSIAGWIGANYLLLTIFPTSRNIPGFSPALKRIAGSLSQTWFFIVSAGVALPWAIKRLKQTTDKKPLVVRSVVPSVILTPALAVAGIALIILIPYCLTCAKYFVVGPNVVQSAWSPDENFKAYVVDKPSFDPPNHHLYVHNKAGGAAKLIAKLPEDVDFIKEIHWSSNSDIVVFQTYFKLIAVYLPNCETAEVTLGGKLHWRENGTSWVDYDDVRQVAAIKFPKPGAFSYRFEGSDKSKIIEMDSL